ncbi:MAG: DNA translocase FtsK 4TM domain-containing protein [Bacteroidales bacterium]|nr:DNA translocase FtsK 4TM domain-containing protein [Bacteroidales bacterium]
MGRRKLEEYVSPVDKVRNMWHDDRFRMFMFLTLMFTAFLMLIGFISYLAYWKEDQSVFDLGFWSYIFRTDIQVQNWGSKWGAVLAHVFMHYLFGVSAFVIIFITLITAFRFINYEPIPYGPAVKHSGIWMLWLCLLLGFISDGDSFPYGGVLGYHASFWLVTVVGNVGTILFIIILAALILMFSIENSLPWMKIFFHNLKKYRNLKTAFENANTFTQSLPSSKDKEQQPSQRRKYRKESDPDDDDDYGNVDFGDDDSGDSSDSASSLNSAVNTPGAKSDTGKSIGSFFKDIFKGKDYVGKEQKINFDEPASDPKSQRDPFGDPFPDRKTRNNGPEVIQEKFVIGGSGDVQETEASGQDDLVDFEVEHASGSDDDIQAPDPNQQPVEILPGTDNSNPQPLGGDQMAMEVEISHEVRADDISNLPPYDPTADLHNYTLPPVSLLRVGGEKSSVSNAELTENKTTIVNVLKDFKIKITKISARIGPTVTLYEITPAPGIKISKIQNLEKDIMMNIKAKGIRIIAPIPGRGTVGIEVPNKTPETVTMESLVSSAKYQNTEYELPLMIGKTVSSEAYMIDLVKCPHMLVAGATGQGKSVGLNAIIASILYKKHPAQVKFVLVDPKKVELTLYKRIEKHFLAKLPNSDDAIITEVDQVKATLNSLTVEMTNRYDLLKEAECRNIKEYNAKFVARRLNPERGHKFLPYIVVVIDEFADLIMTAGKDVEKPLARLAQLARAIGIHLIVATQRPDVKVITGTIKANFPVRIAFRVMSQIDSRTILDQSGAENLIGRGDMLINTGSEITRLQCAFIDTPELEDITQYIASQQGYVTTYELPEPDIEAGEAGEEVDLSRRDSLFEEAARIVVTTQQGSTSMLQRKLEIGYNRAGRIMDQLEAAGIVGPNEGSKARAVNIDNEYALEQFINNLDRSL